ncbi:IPT/TIG domain-containing protein [Flagellimonas myxillae]|uniref:IPT/TIG domain-containing protein n=1 Tax=Flagellimonas myxillae TaxID=2942214 RepID=UPI00201F8D34|nr:IPT/TIG domain-containing protein [Muricauda myxillae]MCL6266128.1 IPT/TIG domain-containing protein [Muricauda myxillae]
MNLSRKIYPFLVILILIAIQACKKDSTENPIPVNEPAPEITSFTPDSGTEGTEVTIVGKNFGSTIAKNEVRFGNSIAEITSASTVQLVVNVPENATTAAIKVTVAGQSGSSATNFTVKGSPAITSFTPNYGGVGKEIVIDGENFGATLADNEVFFGNTIAPIANANEEQLIVNIPEGATSGPIKVITGGLTATSQSDFTVVPPPLLSNLSQWAGKPGDEITITGEHFGTIMEDITVIFHNGIDAEVILVDDMELTVTVPDEAATGIISVMVDGQSVSTTEDFMVFPSGFEEQLAKVLANDGAAFDSFGVDIAMFGDKAIVGAPKDDDNGSSSGSAYIFERNGENWDLMQKLIADDGAVSDNFGSSVDIHGDYAIVGATGGDDNGSNSGSAYIFENNNNGVWVQIQKLIANDGEANDTFGRSVAIHDQFAIVGATGDDDNGSSSGSSYIYANNLGSWSFQSKITAPDGDIGDLFGNSVSIYGNQTIVGASGDDKNGDSSGSAYIFVYDAGTWNLHRKLIPTDGTINQSFGFSVTINVSFAAVGAYKDNFGQGAVYLYKKSDDWAQEEKLIASDGEANDNFGRSIAIDGNSIVVGAYGNDLQQGSTYVFQNNGDSWIQKKLTAVDGAEDDRFGYSVAIYGNYIGIGSNKDDDNGQDSGSVYFY